MKFGVVGHSRNGKDAAAEMLAEIAGLRYSAGTSFYAKEIVFSQMTEDGIIYKDAKHCWDDRHNHRMRWAKIIGIHNESDPVKLYKECLDNQDLLTGIRWRHEFEACKAAKLVDLWIWVERPGFPPDPTCQVTKEDCDRVIVNDGGLPDLWVKVSNLAKELGILR